MGFNQGNEEVGIDSGRVFWLIFAFGLMAAIQKDHGKWYVHPFPASCPLLSDGLHDEPPSTKDFREVYTVQK